MSSHAPSVSIVIPTEGRHDLSDLLLSLTASCAHAAPDIVVADERRDATSALEVSRNGGGAARVVSAACPVAARNAATRSASADWVVFLDEDVVVTTTWYADLCADLAAARPRVGGVRGRTVPAVGADDVTEERLSGGRPHGDIAYRRLVLLSIGGFGERFPRACSRDAELAHRVVRSGWRVTQGRRGTLAPGAAASIGSALVVSER